MADGQHKLSRRALLGAVCASPLVRHAPPRHSGLDPESMNTALAEPDTGVFMDPGLRRDDEWGRALANLQKAQAVLDAAKSEPDQDRYDAFLDAHSEALGALLALPAADLPALAAKLDHIVAQQAWENTGSEHCLEILRHDATASPQRPLDCLTPFDCLAGAQDKLGLPAKPRSREEDAPSICAAGKPHRGIAAGPAR
jgi:hypothetical protein